MAHTQHAGETQDSEIIQLYKQNKCPTKDFNILVFPEQLFGIKFPNKI